MHTLSRSTQWEDDLQTSRDNLHKPLPKKIRNMHDRLRTNGQSPGSPQANLGSCRPSRRLHPRRHELATVVRRRTKPTAFERRNCRVPSQQRTPKTPVPNRARGTTTRTYLHNKTQDRAGTKTGHDLQFQTESRSRTVSNMDCVVGSQ